MTLLTLVTMVAELAAGWWSASMALWADGWHMGTHAAALGGAALAGTLARRASRDSAYAFGGWKIEMLAAYTGGLMLLGASLWLVIDAVGVLRQASRALVDATADDALRRRVRTAIETDGDATVADLHVWQVGPRSWSVAASLVAHHPLESTVYRDRLAAIAQVHHVTIAVHRCRGAAR